MAHLIRVKGRTKRECLMRCIEREKHGYECIRKIEEKYRYRKDYRRVGKGFAFNGIEDERYFEAIYRKVD